MAENNYIPRPKSWKDAQSRTDRVIGTPKTGKVFRLGLLFMGVAGAVAAWLLFIKPVNEPFYLAVVVTEYKNAEYPPNYLAGKDIEALAHLVTSNSFDKQELSLIRVALADLTNQTNPNVVVHISAHAVNDPRRGVCILPGDARPDEPATWLPLEEVLEAVRKCPAKHRLLILDVMKPIADPRLGILANDIAGRVEKAVENEKDFLVLCACSRGQVTRLAESAGQSAFGYYLVQGLKGAADGWNPAGKTNGRVSIRELAAFLGARVDGWARNHQTRQTPVLLGKKDEDFEWLALKPASGPTEVTESAPLEGEQTYPSPLLDGWKKRDAWWKDDSYRLVPRRFRQLEIALLRAEARWRGGFPLDRIQRELDDEIAGFLHNLKNVRALASAIPKAARKADPKVTKDLQDLVEKLGTDKSKWDDLAKPLVAEIKKMAPAIDLDWTFFEAAAADQNPGRDRLVFLANLLNQLKRDPLKTEETVLRRLGTLKVAADKWPTDAVKILLRVARQEVDVMTQCDPRAFPWIRELLDSAAKKRQVGEEALFSGLPSRFPIALASLGEAEQAYKKAQTVLESIQETQRLWDEAMAILPAYAAYCDRRPAVDHQDENNWLEAVAIAQDLFTRLATVPAGDDFDAKVQELRGQAGRLRALFGPGQLRGISEKDGVESLKVQTERVDANPKLYWDIQAMLAATLLRAEGRETLWKAGLGLEQRLQEKTTLADRQDIQAGQRTTGAESSPSDRDHWEREERERAAQRARFSVALLRLAGFAGVGSLQETLGQITPDQGADRALSIVALDLRQAWAQRLPTQLQGETNLAAADRLFRLMPSWETGNDQTIGTLNRNYAQELRQQEARTFAGWSKEE